MPAPLLDRTIVAAGGEAHSSLDITREYKLHQSSSWPQHVPIPQSFICPLTKTLMNNPVIDREGNSYKKESTLRYIQLVDFSPVTDTPLQASDLVEDRGLQMAIQAALKAPVEGEPERSTKRPKAHRFHIANSLSSSVSSLPSRMKEAIHRLSRTRKGRTECGRRECDNDGEGRNVPKESSLGCKEEEEANQCSYLQDCSLKIMRCGVMATDDEALDAIADFLEDSLTNCSDSEEVGEGILGSEHCILQDSVQALCPHRDNAPLPASGEAEEGNQCCERLIPTLEKLTVTEKCVGTLGAATCLSPCKKSLPLQAGVQNVMVENSNGKETATNQGSLSRRKAKTAEETSKERSRRKISDRSAGSAACKESDRKTEFAKKHLGVTAPSTNDAVRAEERFEERLTSKLSDGLGLSARCNERSKKTNFAKQLLEETAPSAPDAGQGKKEEWATREKLSELLNFAPKSGNNNFSEHEKPEPREQSNFEKLLLKKMSADNGCGMNDQKQSCRRAERGEGKENSITGTAISDPNTSEGSCQIALPGERSGKCPGRRTLLYEGLDSILARRRCDPSDDTHRDLSVSGLNSCNGISQFDFKSRDKPDWLPLRGERAANYRDRRALLYEGLDTILARRRCAAANE